MATFGQISYDIEIGANQIIKRNAGDTDFEAVTLAGGGDMLSTNNLSDVANAGTARTNLGLGTLATQSGTFSGTSSGTNTGNETASTLGATINGAAAATPNDTDLVATVDTSVVKKITWTNVKAFLKTYFDTLYQAILVSGTNIKTINGSSVLGSGDLVVSGSLPDVVITKYAPALDQTITAGYCAYYSGYYEIADTKYLEIGDGSVLEIG